MNVEALGTSMGTPPAVPEAARVRKPLPGSVPQVPDLPGQPASDARHSDAREAIAEANRRLAQKASELTFEFDESAERVIVRLVDKQTGQVLRQIPSKEALEIARSLQEESAGALLRADA